LTWWRACSIGTTVQNIVDNLMELEMRTSFACSPQGQAGWWVF